MIVLAGQLDGQAALWTDGPRIGPDLSSAGDHRGPLTIRTPDRAGAARDGAVLQGLGPGSRAPDAHEQPRPGRGGGPGPPHRVRRHRSGGAQLGGVRRHRPRAPAPRERRDAPRPERQAGRRVPHHDRCASGPDRQRHARPPLGHLGAVPRAGATRPDDVRPDDRRVVDLHRDPGNHPGHVRDLRRGGAPAIRRLPARDGDADRGPGRDGRRPAAGGHDERGSGAGHRGGPGPRRATARGGLRGRGDDRPGRGGPQGRRLARGRRGAEHRAGRERRRRGAGARAPRLAPRCRDRPDVRPRPAGRLRARWHRSVGGPRAPRARSGGVRPAGQGIHR